MKRTKDYNRKKFNILPFNYEENFHKFFEHKLEISFIKDRLSTQELGTIAVPTAIYSKYRDQKVMLYNPLNNLFVNVLLTCDITLSGNICKTTHYVLEQLDVKNNDEIIDLCIYISSTYSKKLFQRIDNIKNDLITISPADYNDIIANFESHPCALFEVYNALTKDSFIVQRSHITIDKTLAKGSIRLTRKQRLWLNVELPYFISNEVWDLLKSSIPSSNNDLLRAFTEVYDEKTHTLQDSAPYDKKELVKNYIKNHSNSCIKIIPVVESYKCLKKKSIFRRISDVFVGKSTISLLARRPYETDEGVDVVRISKANMNVLGINEMDKVTLSYKNRKFSCRVLELDDKDAFLKTNTLVNTDLAIGIPTHIRKALGVTDIKSLVKVDRDTVFIFRKSINEQIIPTLLAFLSINLVTDLKLCLSILLIILALPIIFYLNLSSKRNMRAK